MQLSINCSKCGATNKFDQESIPTFCSFCGAALPNMLPYVEDAIKITLERQRHEMQMESADKDIKKEQIRSLGSKADIVRYIAAAITLLAVIGFCFFVLAR